MRQKIELSALVLLASVCVLSGCRSNGWPICHSTPAAPFTIAQPNGLGYEDSQSNHSHCDCQEGLLRAWVADVQAGRCHHPFQIIKDWLANRPRIFCNQVCATEVASESTEPVQDDLSQPVEEPSDEEGAAPTIEPPTLPDSSGYQRLPEHFIGVNNGKRSSRIRRTADNSKQSQEPIVTNSPIVDSVPAVQPRSTLQKPIDAIPASNENDFHVPKIPTKLIPNTPVKKPPQDQVAKAENEIVLQAVSGQLAWASVFESKSVRLASHQISPVTCENDSAKRKRAHRNAVSGESAQAKTVQVDGGGVVR